MLVLDFNGPTLCLNCMVYGVVIAVIVLIVVSIWGCYSYCCRGCCLLFAAGS